jgi:DNA-binding GntR family transcriptional regulator
MLRTGEIYQILRDEIIQGKLNPGERLVENDLCERLGSTRGYIREALKLLRADGFVILNHGKGATVAKVSYQETRDLYQLLAILESKSTEFATPHMEFADVQELIKTNHTMESCIHIEDRAAARKVWQEANLRFHRTIAEKCGNKEMEMLVENIRWRTFDFRYVYFFETHFTFFCHQHDDLIEAIQEKNAQKARQLMEDHVNKASELALLNLKPAPSL